MTFQPSPYQAKIFDWIKAGTGNAVVNAVAGSGKTTTLEQAAKLLPAGRSAVFVAFNNHIVGELRTRLAGTSMVAVTVHSAGRSALAKMRKLGEPDTKKYNKIVKSLFERARLDVAYDDIMAIVKLVDQVRNSLANPRDEAALYRLAARFDLEVTDSYLHFVADALQIGEDQARNAGLIDFTDMIYLPIKFGLSPAQSDVVFGDEIQDWSPMQLELVCRMVAPGGRFLGVGDPRQSIMAFAGADDQSFWRIKSRLSATELPLSVCYRCPTSHIALAQEYVPGIEPFEGKDQGTVTYAKDPDLFKLVQPGDLILCRKTAPLVKNCIALIGQGVAAKVRGRNIGKQLTDLAKTVSKMTAFTVDEFPKYLDQYRETQVRFLAQKEDADEMIEALNDRCAALDTSFRRYYDKGSSFEAILAQIEDLFSDDRPSVWLSTIHRAKGLEADRVMILQYDTLPLEWKNQQEYQYVQEQNLVYVALTRAKRELIIFGEKPEPVAEQPLLIPEPLDFGDCPWLLVGSDWQPFDFVYIDPIPAIQPEVITLQAATADFTLEDLCEPMKTESSSKTSSKSSEKSPALPAGSATFPGHGLSDRQHLEFERQCLLAKCGKLTDAQLVRLDVVCARLGYQPRALEMAVA